MISGDEIYLDANASIWQFDVPLWLKKLDVTF